jgi:hypothetical protein
MAEDDKPNVFEKFVDDVKNFATSFASDVGSIFSGGEDSGGERGPINENMTPMPTGEVDFTLPPTSPDDEPPVVATIDYGDRDRDEPTIKSVKYYDDTGKKEIPAPKVGYDPLLAYVDPKSFSGPEDKAKVTRIDPNNPVPFFGKLLGLSVNDPVVGQVDGKYIYRRADGTTYSYNALGLPYDTVSATSLEEDPKQVRKREQMMLSSQFDDDDDDDDFLIDEEEDIAEIDPCPEGYVMNEETGICELDPFQVPFADPVTTTTTTPTTTTLPTATGVVTQTAGIPGAYTPIAASPLMTGGANLTQFVPPTPYSTPITVAAQTPQGLASLRRS